MFLNNRYVQQSLILTNKWYLPADDKGSVNVYCIDEFPNCPKSTNRTWPLRNSTIPLEVSFLPQVDIHIQIDEFTERWDATCTSLCPSVTATLEILPPFDCMWQLSKAKPIALGIWLIRGPYQNFLLYLINGAYYLDIQLCFQESPWSHFAR